MVYELKSVRIILLTASLLCGFHTQLDAQRSQFDVSAGYSIVSLEFGGVRADDEGDREPLNGWLAAAGWNVTSPLAVIGEVAANYYTIDLDNLGKPSIRFLSYLVGPRLSWRNRSRVTPYGQFLSGGVQLRLHDELFDSSGHSRYGTCIEPGGGVDIRVTPRFGARLGADYRRMWIDTGILDTLRFYTGAVMGIGTR